MVSSAAYIVGQQAECSSGSLVDRTVTDAMRLYISYARYRRLIRWSCEGEVVATRSIGVILISGGCLDIGCVIPRSISSSLLIIALTNGIHAGL